MRIEVFSDAGQFRAAAAPVFDADPVTTNVIAVVTEQIAKAEPDASDPSGRFFVVDLHGPAGAAMLTPPWNLFVSDMPVEAVPELVEAVAAAGCVLPGVTGVDAVAAQVAARWSDHAGVTARPAGGRHVYVLDALVMPSVARGRGRRFGPDEVDLVADWLGRFHAEAVPEDPTVDTHAVARRRIEAGELWAWEVMGRPVALAACSAPAIGVARVGPVYTPPAERRNGYGSGVTASATRAALDDGAQRVMLYADVANATSNAIYRHLGYRHDHDALAFQFVADPEGSARPGHPG